jgi:hypothetical protein
MEFKTKHIRGGRWYSTQIELIIKSENTTITEDLIPWNGFKVEEEFITNLENLIQELKDHNQCVDEYNEALSKP